MTDDEWDSVSFLLEEGWRGEFDDSKRAAYRVFLDKFEPQQVVGALHALIETGPPFLPAVSEIVQQIRKTQEPPVPGWTEVWELLCKAMRCSTAEIASEFCERHSPIVARFLEAEGWKRLRETPYFDPDYGGIRQKEVQLRWEGFVDVAKERLVQGRALAASGQRKELGARRLDQVALLDAVRPETAGELGAGDTSE